MISGFSDAIIIFGLFICPIFGGIFRSAVANRRDLLWIIPGIAFLDIVLFIPLVCVITDWTDFFGGMGFGLFAAGVMVVVGLITVGIRALIEKNSNSNYVRPSNSSYSHKTNLNSIENHSVPNKSKKCSNCGEIQYDNAAYCGNCGSSIS